MMGSDGIAHYSTPAPRADWQMPVGMPTRPERPPLEPEAIADLHQWIVFTFDHETTAELQERAWRQHEQRRAEFLRKYLNGPPV